MDREYLLRTLFREKYRLRWSPEFLRDMKRIDRGEPIDYVIGWTPFLGCRINLSERPFIPRPETEYWTERFLETVKARREPLRILDAFAGSGCIGIAVLRHLSRARVDFLERNPRFVRQIKKNLAENGIRGRRSHVICAARIPRARYDAILANPPYIPLSRARRVAKEVLRYEPRAALFGGRDGLRHIRRLIREAPRSLRPGGVLWFEFDSPERHRVAGLLRRARATYAIHKDQYGKFRYATASFANPRKTR